MLEANLKIVESLMVSGAYQRITIEAGGVFVTVPSSVMSADDFAGVCRAMLARR